MKIKKERNDKRKIKGGNGRKKERKKEDRNACSCCTDWQYESISFTKKSSIIK